MPLVEFASGVASYIYRAIFVRFTDPSAAFLINIAFYPVIVLIGWAVTRILRRPSAKLTRPLLISVGASFGIFFLNQIFFPVLDHGTEPVHALYKSLHVPRLPESLWQGVPTFVAVVVGVIVVDFATYWAHRAMHWRWIWPIHAIHHSDPVVRPPTSLRVHVLELVMMSLTYLLFVSWLSLPKESFAPIALVLLVHNHYVHLDVDWTHGPLKYVIASPRFHRWHHADAPEAIGKNLANLIPLWDVLFGTYYAGGPCTGRLGAEGVPENDVVKLMLFPLTEWGRMLRALAKRDQS